MTERDNDLRAADGWPGRADADLHLRDGLAAARQRTGDEITRRRIWSELAALPSLPPPRRRAPARAAFTTMAIAAAAAVVGGGLTIAASTWLDDGRDETPVVASSSPGQSASPPQPAPEEDFVQGPAEIKTGAHETMRVRLRGGARAALGTHTRLVVNGKHEPSLERGHVRMEVAKQAPGHQFALTAGPYVIRVIGTRFSVDHGSTTVAVQVEEGVVQVERGDHKIRVTAGQNWTGWLDGRAVQSQAPRRVRADAVTGKPSSNAVAWQGAAGTPTRAAASTEPAPPPASHAHAAAAQSTTAPDPSAHLSSEARAALAAGDADRALALLAVLSRRSGVAGENAVYEMGRIWRDQKRQPRQALDVWHRYRKDHPTGLLRPEVDLSIFETYVSLSDTAKALNEGEAFVARHPRSERRADVERLLQVLRAKQSADIDQR